MSKTHSPAQAALKANVSRWTILRAIKNGDIKAHRDNKNHWRVDDKSLGEWRSGRGVHTVLAHLDAHPNSDDKIRVAQLETENKFLKDQVTDLKQDRDAWRKQAERITQPFWKSWFSDKNDG